DERVLQPGVDLAIDLVTALLEALDLGDPLVEPVIVVDQLGQPLGSGREIVTVGGEQVEELDVPRDQAKRHGRSPDSADSDAVEDDPGNRRREAGRGDRDDPGDQDAPGDTPANAAGAARRANA